MKRGELINKGIAAAITLGFMTAVRPDAEPTRVEATIVALLMYEGIRFCVEFCRRKKQKKYISLNLKARNEDGKRWADEWITPAIREVN